MLGDAVVLAVDHHVQARIEEVLVGRAAKSFSHHTAPRIGLACSNRRRLDDAGQLDLELDRSVLVEVPVEAIVVVSHGREKGNDQTPRTPHFKRLVAKFVMLPEDP